MAPRREILDSEDDDDGNFSPVKSPPVGSFLPGEITPTVDGAPNTENTRETRSTDPSFFQSVYDEQQTAADGRMAAPERQNIIDDATSLGMSPPSTARLRHQARERNSSSLTSITDPRHRRSKGSGRKDVIDLTQVTTPGRPRSSDHTDLWDIPSSPAAQAAGNAGIQPSHSLRTYGKRKRGQGSSPHEREVLGRPVPSVAETLPDGSPRVAKKRVKRDQQTTLSRPSQEVELVLVPGTEENLREEDPSCGNPDGISSTFVKDTLDTSGAASLYVTPSVLTASQKRQYEFVSLSSEGDKDDMDMSLLRGLQRPEAAHASSGTTTIAYTTPSRYASSGHRNSTLEDVAGPPSTGQRRGSRAVIEDPPSSPDIISQPSTMASRKRKRGAARADDFASSEPSAPREPLSLTQRSSRRTGRFGSMQDEVPLNLGSQGYEQERDAAISNSPRRSRARAPIETNSMSEGRPSSAAAETGHGGGSTAEAGVIVDGNDIEPNLSTHPDQAAEELSAITHDESKPKKRGRKKKEVTAQEPAEAQGAGVGSNANSTEDPVPPADSGDGISKVKRKRGRPRKSETTKSLAHQVLSVSESEGPHEQQDTPAGNGTEVEATAAASVNTTRDEPSIQDQPLKEMDRNLCVASEQRDAGPAEGSEVISLAKASQAAEKRAEQKAGKGDGQTGKVQYRVGLSKRSRIAPLLKSLRK